MLEALASTAAHLVPTVDCNNVNIQNDGLNVNHNDLNINLDLRNIDYDSNNMFADIEDLDKDDQLDLDELNL